MTIPTAVLDELPTPCLIIDVAAADRNIRAAKELLRGGEVRLRPHFKAHKCTRLMWRQLAAGGCTGVTCQTAEESLVLAREGFDDILVANEVVDPYSLRCLVEAAHKAHLGVAVDDTVQVARLSDLCREERIQLDILIELDVGIGRCGLPVGDPRLLAIADAVENDANLLLRGLQAYEGHVVLKEDRELRRTLTWQALQQALHERDRLQSAGFPCGIISGGGTGTLDIAPELGVLSEVQAGSYVLLDARYDSLGLGLEPALFCCTRVISRRSPEAAVLNVGLKGLTVEYGMPRALTPGVKVIALSDEHARVAISPPAEVAIGDPVLLVPAHIDPAVNLYDILYAWEEGAGLEEWPVDGRRRLGGMRRTVQEGAVS